MADLSPLINLKPETITAVGEFIKTMFGLILTGIGAFNLWITNKNNKITAKNTKVTETNTAAKGISVDVLAAHKAEMTDLKDQTVKEFRTIIEEQQRTMILELDKVKIVFMRVSNQAEAKLSMIPKIDQAVEARLRRVEQASAKIAIKLGAHDE